MQVRPMSCVTFHSVLVICLVQQPVLMTAPCRLSDTACSVSTGPPAVSFVFTLRALLAVTCDPLNCTLYAQKFSFYFVTFNSMEECDISGSRGDGYEDGCLPGCWTVLSGRNWLTFQRCFVPSSCRRMLQTNVIIVVGRDFVPVELAPWRALFPPPICMRVDMGQQQNDVDNGVLKDCQKNLSQCHRKI
jgi:hypothetical protein